MDAFVVFIRRPVFATMVTAFLVVLGLLSYASLGVEQFPNVDIPSVTITTTLRGASPAEVETQITKPLEESINTINGIDELRSYSMEGASFIGVNFLLEKNTAEAVQDVRDRVSQVARQLPTGHDPPIVYKWDLDDRPIVGLVVFGPRDQRALWEIADKRVKPLIETIDGVGAVNVFGGWKRAINLVLDGQKLQALGLSVQQVVNAIRAQHVDIPGGRIQRGTMEYGLRTMARVRRVQEFNALVLAEREGRQITLGDVGRAEDGYEEPRSITRVWGRGDPEPRRAVVLLVRKQSGMNELELTERVIGRLDVIRKSIPADIGVEVAFEGGSFVRRSINEVKLHLTLGAILASLVCFFFIRDWRATIIAALAIPTSIISTFAFIKAMGFTINNMTMLALTLSVGIVIDDAIVVLENIYRQMDEQRKPPQQAAIDGLKEIALAVLATTFSLVVIFLPIAFMSGRPGRFWHSYGVTVAFAILVSLLVSFTLTPMLCSRWLRVRPGHKHHWTYEIIDRVWGRLLRWSLAHRWVVIVISVALFATTFPIFGAMGKNFLPSDDRSQFQVKVELPEGSSLQASDEVFKEIERDVSKLRGVKALLTIVGDAGRGAENVTRGQIFVMLDDIHERDFSQFDVMADARKLRKKYPGVKVSINEMWGVGGVFPISFDIRGPDLKTLFDIANRFVEEMRRTPGFSDVDSTLSKRSPELQVMMRRLQASDLRVKTGEVALYLRALVGGVKIARFQEGAEQYDVWVRVEHADRQSASAIAHLPMGAPSGSPVLVRQLAHIQEGHGPLEIVRLDRQRTVTVTSNLDGIDLGRGIAQVKEIEKRMQLPEGYTVTFGGRGKVFREMFGNFAVAFLLAFLFMYMILAAQFESFLHPITILLSLPLSLPCALFSLFALGDDFNLYSGLGLFMLFGVVKKNGILQIDYTNTLRHRGLPVREAVLQANHARLRPILMTTLTLIVGMIPIALGKGPGAAARASMAKVIIGGQALSLVISLLIVPVVYTYFTEVPIRARAQIGRGTFHFVLWALAGIPWAVARRVVWLVVRVLVFWRPAAAERVLDIMGHTPIADPLLHLWRRLRGPPGGGLAPAAPGASGERE